MLDYDENINDYQKVSPYSRVFDIAVNSIADQPYWAKYNETNTYSIEKIILVDAGTTSTAPGAKIGFNINGLYFPYFPPYNGFSGQAYYFPPANRSIEIPLKLIITPDLTVIIHARNEDSVGRETYLYLFGNILQKKLQPIQTSQTAQPITENVTKNYNLINIQKPEE